MSHSNGLHSPMACSGLTRSSDGHVALGAIASTRFRQFGGVSYPVGLAILVSIILMAIGVYLINETLTGRHGSSPWSPLDEKSH